MDFTKPVQGQDMVNALAGEKCIVMAANIRVTHSARGIMMAAKELDAAVMFEIAKSEIGYTAQPPKAFYDMIVKTAEELEFNQPYVIHGDHITIKENTAEAVGAGEQLIKDEIAAGFTSFAIDASHNFNIEGKTVAEQLADNIEITTKLAALIPETAGLEVEVGEVGKVDPKTGEKALTSVEEAETFIKAIRDAGFSPNLLATNNGTTHGNIYDKEGNIVEQVGIDIDRTKAIADAIAAHGVYVAQHGITGTPLNLMHLLIDAGVFKGNVGTNWQNIALDTMPSDLVKSMEEWTLTSKHAEKMKAKKPGISEKELIGKNIKHSIKEFKEEIDSLPAEDVEKIDEASKKSAIGFFKAFNAQGTAGKVKAFIEGK
ncbi:MAG: class II fructose-bisphosphate aldolase [Candidatus Altiarchaeales archaeon]|nr:class II fructose-bisphosphate aldolase [Candidatus Altiarchaeales archaeon]MBD3416258.1 class II fructose-bisphosphate aldolase [Candidatus Altiarchaeales archaeon]